MNGSLMRKLRSFTGAHMLLLVAAIALFAALSRYIAVYYSYLLFSVILIPLAYLSGGVALFSTDTGSSRAFRVLLLFLLWTIVSVVINERRGESLIANQADLGALAVLVFVCFPAGYLADRTLAQKFLKGAAVATVALVALIDGAALAMAAAGRYVMLPWNAQYGLGIMPWYQRLAALCYPNSVGMIGMIAIVLSIYLFMKTKHPLSRVLCAVGGVVILIAIALANARTAEIALALALGFIAFTIAYHKTPRRKTFLRWIAAICAAVVIAAASYAANGLLLRGFNSLGIQQRDAIVTTEPVAADAAVDRSIEADVGTFNGRTAIWKAAAAEMQKDKSILLLGTSPALAEQAIGQYAAAQGRNLHNSFLQVLFALGVPGLLLMVVFLVFVAIASLRVVFAPVGQDPADRVLPAALLAVLVLCCMESFLLLYPDAYFANVWFLLLSGYLCRIAPNHVGKQPASS